MSLQIFMAHLPWTQQRQGRVKRRHRIPLEELILTWAICTLNCSHPQSMASAFLSKLSLSEILFMLRGAIHLKAIDPHIHIFSLALNLQFQTHMSKCLLNILAWGFTVTSNWLYPQPKFTSSLYNSSLFRVSYFCQWHQLCQSHRCSKTTVIADTSFYLITKLCQFFLQSGSHLISSPVPASLLAKTSSPDYNKSLPASVLFCSSTGPWFSPNISQELYLLSLTPNDALGFFAFLSPASVLHYALFSLCILSTARVLTTPLSCDSHL